MGARGPEKKAPASGRKRTVKLIYPVTFDEWGQPSHYLRTPTPEILAPPPDYADDPTRYRLAKCQNCAQPIYILKGTQTPRKYHLGCKPQKNWRFGIDPQDQGREGEAVRAGTPKRNHPICGASLAKKYAGKLEIVNSQGTIIENPVCCQPAGWGTNHLGIGSCKFHMGNSHSQEMAAVKKKIQIEGEKRMLDLYGEPKEVDPITAILDEVRRTVGHVEWLRATIVTMGEDPDGASDTRRGTKVLHQHTPMGIGPSVWIQMYQQERAHLVRVCQAAVGMGVAERTVKLAEDQGRLIAAVLRATFEDPELGLTPAQKAAYPQIVRRHLLGVPSADAATGKVSLPASKELE